MTATVRATFARGAWSTRQSLELMVEFWSNHLNTTAPFGVGELLVRRCGVPEAALAQVFPGFRPTFLGLARSA